jgi:hypothetical protein
MKIALNVTVFFLICFAVIGCKKYNTDYKSFLDHHEVVYPGLASGVTYHAGNLRTVLVWHPSPDPTIKNYVVFWNNGLDSLVVNATTHDPADSITVNIPNLKEYVYSFKIIAHDSDGNVSIGQDLNNVRVYGPIYKASLLNRGYNTANPYELHDDGSVTLYFNKADTGNVSTTVKYIDKQGATKEKSFIPDSGSVTLPNFKLGTAPQYKSSYKPAKNAIDIFETNSYDNFIKIYGIVEIDKSLFKTNPLPTDIGSAYQWELNFLWDKSTNEPGFHTPGADLPIWFTIDLTNKVALAKLRLWQRTSALYDIGNAKRFEVWGTNAPNANGDWNGWTKLASFNSFKPSGLPPGQTTQADRDFAAAGEPFTFHVTVPEVRYIRFKILETWGGQNYFHALEISLFKQDR